MNQKYLQILRLRKPLQEIAQVSYSYSQINRRFPPIEKLSEDELVEMLQFYQQLIKDSVDAVREFNKEVTP